MPNTQVPPEGTFSSYYREVETHEWYSTLSPEAKQVLNAVVIKPFGFGFCKCYSPEKLYTYTNSDNTTYVRCDRCIRHLLSSEMTEWREVYALLSNTPMSTVFPYAHYPEHTEARCICRVCDKYILKSGDYQPAGMNTDIDYMREIYAQDTDGNMVSAHVRCTYKCGECEVVKLLAGRHDNLQVDGTPTCTTCIDDLSSRDQIGRCPYCGQYFTHMMYCEQRDRELCESCYDQGWDCDECGYTIYAGDDHECYRDRDSLIYDYSHKPRPEFYGRDDYYFGIELEVEDKCEWGCNSGAEIVLETVGNRMYMKHDGSLDNGFEIVSHPHSLDELKNEVNWGFLTRLKNAGFRSWDTSTCGLHVHVSRTAFRKNGKHDEAHELRFQKLIYDNDKHVSAIAGRETSYARFADKGNLVPKVKHGQSADRYEAINILNDHTLEIRVFRGSLKKQRVLSAVEFIHSAVEYTRNMKIDPKTKQLSWVRFMGYVMDNQEKYPNFTQIALSALDNMRVSLSQSRDSEEN